MLERKLGAPGDAEGARAYLRMEHGEQLGKLVLEVTP